jgi:hypothetical protein
VGNAKHATVLRAHAITVTIIITVTAATGNRAAMPTPVDAVQQSGMCFLSPMLTL